MNEEDKLALWRQCVGEKVSLESITVLGQSSKLVEYPSGTCLVDQHELSGHVFLIVSGMIKSVRYSRNGHEIWLSGFSAGELAGEISTLTQKTRSSALIVEKDVCLLQVADSTFDLLMDQDAKFARAIASIVARRLVRTSSHLEDLMVTPVISRLHAELITLGEEVPGDEELFRLHGDVTVAKLSERIHASREATSRALTVLEQRGLARRGATGIEVISPIGIQN